MMKVGIVGTGKRFENVYKRVLELLGCEIYIWNRTLEKIKIYEEKKGYVILESLGDLNRLNLDLCISFLPPDKPH